MPLFDVITSPLCIALLIAGAVVLTASTLMMLPLRRVRRRPAPSPQDSTQGPAASIVALASNDTDLTDFISAVEGQDYHDFELIIVHEATSQSNDALAEQFPFTPRTDDDGNPTGCRAVRFCFFPPGGHALSHKKLALTIGIKAAENPVVVTTDASCRIDSPLWLVSMMRHFTPQTEVVLGTSAIDFDCLPRSSRPLARQTHLLTQAQWLAAAMARRPYRGDGLNLAYRRDTFFSRKGFADSIDLMNGEDDIFVAAVARGDNSAVELSDASVVRPDRGDETRRIFTDNREHYRFTSSRLPRGPFRMAGLHSVLQWCGVLLCVAAALVATPNLLAAAIAAVIILAAFATQALLYRPAAQALGDRRAWMGAGPLLLARPIDNLCFDMRHRTRRRANYTYRR